MLHWYFNIAVAGDSSKALVCGFSPKVWRRFRDDVFVVWTHNAAKLLSFLDYLNNINDIGKLKFTAQTADEKGLEFADLKIKFLNSKLSVSVYSKVANSFVNVMSSTCYPTKNIKKIPQGIALRLRRISWNRS